MANKTMHHMIHGNDTYEIVDSAARSGVATVENSISLETTSRTSGDASLRAEIELERTRITNFATLTEGSTTGDAELMDVRIGVDGIDYKSAGEAVRNQVSALFNDFINMQPELLNKVILSGNRVQFKDQFGKIPYLFEVPISDERLGKNLLPNEEYAYPDIYEANGITVKRESNGSLNITGTASSDTYYRLSDDREENPNTFKLSNGKYMIYSSENIPSGMFVYVSLVKNGTVVKSDIARSDSQPYFEIDDQDYTNFRIGLKIGSGYSSNEAIKFLPEIRFVSCKIVHCGKNLLHYPYAVRSGSTTGGVDYTINSNGTIILNGNQTGDNTIRLADDRNKGTYQMKLPNGSYILSGGDEVDLTKWNLYISVAKNGTVIETDIARLDYPYFTISSQDYDNLRIGISLRPNASFDNVLVEPMIRRADISNYRYEQYNASIYPMISSMIKINSYKGQNEIFTEESIDVNGYGYSVDRIIASTSQSKNPYCFMSYNVGHWYDGSGVLPPDSLKTDNINLQKSIISRYNPDILATFEYINEDNIMYDYYKNVKETVPTYSKNGYHAVGSNYNIGPITMVVFNDLEQYSGWRYYWYYTTYLNGKEVCIIGTHLALDHDIGKLQMKQIYDFAVTKERFILCGDFNAHCSSVSDSNYINYFKQFADYGCNLANCGDFGFIKTWYPSQSAISSGECLDNIITSSNIDIEYVTTDLQKLSSPIYSYKIDHVPLIAYLHI